MRHRRKKVCLGCICYSRCLICVLQCRFLPFLLFSLLCNINPNAVERIFPVPAVFRADITEGHCEDFNLSVPGYNTPLCRCIFTGLSGFFHDLHRAFYVIRMHIVAFRLKFIFKLFLSIADHLQKPSAIPDNRS